MVVTCRECRSEIPMSEFPSWDMVVCHNCGAEVQSTLRGSIAPVVEEPPTIFELTRRTGPRGAASVSEPVSAPSVDPRIATPPAGLTDNQRSAFYSIEPSIIDMMPELLQPPSLHAPAPRMTRTWARYAGALAGATALAFLGFAGGRWHMRSAPPPSLAAIAATTIPATEPASAVEAKIDDTAPTAADAVTGQSVPSEKIAAIDAEPSRAPARALKTAPKARAIDPAPREIETPAADPTQSAEQLPEFDRPAATAALGAINDKLEACSDPQVGPVTTRAHVTFAPTGRVTTTTIDALPSMMGTPVVGCVIGHLRGAQVAPFAGDKVTIHTTISFQ
jgi:hypothetical protein